MKKIALVLKNEIVSMLTRPSFWLGALGLPLVGTLIFAAVGFIKGGSSTADSVSQIFTDPQQVLPEGYVDLSGLIVALPASVPPGMFIAYPSEDLARLALEAGEISAFYIVAADYLDSGIITYVRPDFNPLAGASESASGLFGWIMDVNLAGGDMLFASIINGPIQVQEVPLAPQTTPDEDNPLAYWAPYAITLLFYMLIISSASLLLTNISKEKENRVIEVLLTSVTPHQLLTGKILGLGIVGLGQTILWLATAYVLGNIGDRTFNLPSTFQLPLSFILWGVVFFLLGYGVYASLMAGVGALAPNLREGSQATMLVMLPLMIPLFFSSTVFMNDPHGPIATGFSLFPLSAPVAMMARLSSGGVPGWQIWLAVVLLAGTTVLIVRAVAGMFRAQALLSGQGFNVKIFLKALVGKM